MRMCSLPNRTIVYNLAAPHRATSGQQAARGLKNEAWGEAPYFVLSIMTQKSFEY